jgi:RNA-splicing ligase RtcB
MSRGQAKRELSVESLQESMAGRTWGVQDAKALLDEHPNAYKDIDAVMEDAKDLVAPVYQLAQIVNYKGL